MLLDRRNFIAGLGTGLICAPAIVRATSLMPIKPLLVPAFEITPEQAEEMLREDEAYIARLRASGKYILEECSWSEWCRLTRQTANDLRPIVLTDRINRR